MEQEEKKQKSQAAENQVFVMLQNVLKQKTVMLLYHGLSMTLSKN